MRVASSQVRRGVSTGELTFILFLVLAGLACAGWMVYRQTVRTAPLPTALAAITQPDVAEAARSYVRKNKPTALTGDLVELLAQPDSFHVKSEEHPLVGKQAPDFTCPDHLGRPWSLAQALRRGPVIVVFYYGYHCDHCVSQLFDLSEDAGYFQQLGAEIVALSPDALATTQDRFAQYGTFAFPVLQDKDYAVAERYGCAWKVPASGEYEQKHGCFVVAPSGQIVWANTGDEPFTGNRTLLYELHRLRAGESGTTPPSAPKPPATTPAP